MLDRTDSVQSRLASAGVSREHRVAVVVDPALASVVAELAQDRHVWAVRVTGTEKVATNVWLDNQKGQHRCNDAGLTLFNGSATPEESFLSILDSVELHHGEYSHDPPLSVIEVLGVDATKAIHDALAELGFTEVSTADACFVARRAADWPPGG